MPNIAVSGNYSFARRFVSHLLPSDRLFWRFYSPIIRVLKDSNQLKNIQEKTTEMLNLRHWDNLLDVGCGRADWLISVSKRVDLTVGVDIEQRMLQAAIENPSISWVPGSARRNHFVLARMEGLPFKDGLFTKINSTLVFGYSGEKDLVFNEFVRLLAPGGRIVITTPKKGANFLKVLLSEVSDREKEGSMLQNLAKLPLAAVAVMFGKIAELKEWTGDWSFDTEEGLAEKFRAAGFRMLESSMVYANQAVMVVAEKPTDKEITPN